MDTETTTIDSTDKEKHFQKLPAITLLTGCSKSGIENRLKQFYSGCKTRGIDAVYMNKFTPYKSPHSNSDKINKAFNHVFDADPLVELAKDYFTTAYIYTFPIITQCVEAEPNSVILIPHPDCCLYPTEQSRLIDLIVQAVGRGVKFGLLSNSEHILNAIRVNILKAQLNNNEVKVCFFGDKAQYDIKIDSDGLIQHWPDGFFAQSDLDYEELFGI